MLCLALKNIQMVKSTPPQIFTLPNKMSPLANFSIPPTGGILPPLNDKKLYCKKEIAMTIL